MINEEKLNNYINECYERYLIKIGEQLNNINIITNINDDYKIMNDLFVSDINNEYIVSCINLFKSTTYFFIIKTFSEFTAEERYKLYYLLLEKLKKEKINGILVLYKLNNKER